jgi:hypothetical protein
MSFWLDVQQMHVVIGKAEMRFGVWEVCVSLVVYDSSFIDSLDGIGNLLLP